MPAIKFLAVVCVFVLAVGNVAEIAAKALTPKEQAQCLADAVIADIKAAQAKLLEREAALTVKAELTPLTLGEADELAHLKQVLGAVADILAAMRMPKPDRNRLYTMAVVASAVVLSIALGYWGYQRWAETHGQKKKESFIDVCFGVMSAVASRASNMQITISTGGVKH